MSVLHQAILVFLVVVVSSAGGQSIFSLREDTACLCSGSQWVRGSGSLLPPGPVYVAEDVPGGVGGPVYIARAQHDNKVLPGKLVRDFGKAVVFDRGVRYEKEDFEILTSHAPLRFVNMTSTDLLPQRAILAGHDEDYSDLFICRASHQGHYIPGKLVASTNRCYVEADFKEHLYLSFQVLIML